MDLSKLIVPSKTIWDEFPGFDGFEVQLAYLTRDELMKLRTKAVNNVVNKKSRKVEEELDGELFQKLYIKAVIKNWRGLQYKYLPRLVPVDLSEVEVDEDGEYIGELEFSTDNADALMKNASGFDTWISDVLEDVENFTKGN